MFKETKKKRKKKERKDKKEILFPLQRGDAGSAFREAIPDHLFAYFWPRKVRDGQGPPRVPSRTDGSPLSPSFPSSLRPLPQLSSQIRVFCLNPQANGAGRHRF